MGNYYNVILNKNNTFIEQLKVSEKENSAVMAIYLYPRDFPNAGLLIVTNKGKYTSLLHSL